MMYVSVRYENFTVVGVISKSNMKYGYAEIRRRQLQ